MGKIKNATQCVLDGIQFKSKLELTVYDYFKKMGVNLEYEKLTFVLMDGFVIRQPVYDKDSKKNLKRITRKVLKTTYTPDFSFKGRNALYVLEIKGFANDVFPLKKKMFLREINDCEQEIFYIMIYSQKDMREAYQIIHDNEVESEPKSDSEIVD